MDCQQGCSAIAGNTRRPGVAYTVMIKPNGPVCSLSCRYCYYSGKTDLYPGTRDFRMSRAVLEEFTRQYISSQSVPEVTFSWQGGEPTLLGLDFFREAVMFQEKYRPSGMQIHNALQTNGMLLDDEWCNFLRQERFLVGLSLDGPRSMHDHYRVSKSGGPTFMRVMRALQLLKKHRVPFNVLCVVSKANADNPLAVYRFFKQQGVRFIQFIPAVGRTGNGEVTEWTVSPEQYGRFLCAVFDEWVRLDVGRVFVQSFEVALGAWLGKEPGLCVFAKTCGLGPALEHNGDLYSCDHFVFPRHFLGNILQTPIEELVMSHAQRQFGLSKRTTLPRYCLECPVLFACNGGCPKDRFIKTPDGEPGLNYLCSAYKMFFTHIRPYMLVMAATLCRGT